MKKLIEEQRSENNDLYNQSANIIAQQPLQIEDQCNVLSTNFF